MEGAFYQQKRLSPTGIAVVALLHGAAIVALVTSKTEMAARIKDPPIHIFPVPIPPPPPPHPVDHKNVSKPQPITTVQRIVHDDPKNDFPPPPPPTDLGPPPFSDTGTGPPEPPAPPLSPPPTHEPVRTGPSIDSGSELQPPYPAAEEREGVEGHVAVRVLIGADGRVKSVEKISATNDAFFLATQRQALHAWRFRPATVDGRPVESSKVMTVTFQLNG